MHMINYDHTYIFNYIYICIDACVHVYIYIYRDNIELTYLNYIETDINFYTSQGTIKLPLPIIAG